MNNIYQTKSAFTFACQVTALSLIAFAGAYVVAEPQVTMGQDATSEFTVSQDITGESSFLVEPADVSMSGSITGLTGGQATGTTDFVVQSNNTSGYYVELAFNSNGTDQAMLGEASDSEALLDYAGDVGGQPSFGYIASTAAQFAYTVASDFSSDTAQSFFNNGAACNTGASQAVTCWKAPEVGGFEIVRRTSPALTGATSTITFNVTVPSGATPEIQSDTYTATATLSLFSL